jgi:hypothetical protein
MHRFTLPEVLLLAALALLLGGCAVVPRPQSCEQFDDARKQTDYTTGYRRDDKEAVKPLLKGAAAMVLQYRLRLDPERTSPCSHVTIHKELLLARRTDAAVVLEETREFFAEDGARIAVKQENLSNQLRQSGRYRASVPLPIPKGAPAGAYHLVSTLTLKNKNETVVLAKTAVSFNVVVATK